MKKNFYIKNKFILYFICIVLTVVLSFLFIIAYSFKSYYQQIQLNNSDTLGIYKGELTAEMSNLLDFNQEIISNNYDFQTLALTNYSVVDKIQCTYSLQKLLSNAVPSYGALYLFDQANDISLYAYGSDYKNEQFIENLQLKEDLKAFFRKGSTDALFNWYLYNSDSRALLLNAYQLHNMYICAMMDLHQFTSYWDFSNNHDVAKIAFFNTEQFLSNAEYMKQHKIRIENLQQKNSFLSALLLRNIIQTTDLIGTDVFLCCVMPIAYLWTYSRISVLLAVSVFAVISILIIVIFHSLNKIMLYPLHQIIAATESIENNQITDFTTNTENAAYEFQKINDALVQLLEQKNSLERDNEQKRKNMEHAQLQYFQLQTRSHFFVNSLKSLYSMLENKEYDRMKLMIIAFSNHLRFIFQDNLSLIPLSFELEEVNDYYNIIRIDRLTPIILLQQVSPELYDCPVPPLLIQTFLENSIKYNGKSAQPLRFVIQAEPIELEGIPHMRLRISDNGIGYSSDLLEKLNCADDNLYEYYHIGINNLKRRIHLIYGEGIQMAFFNAPSGGACALICLPIKQKKT